MNIIKLAASENGARPAIQTWPEAIPPEGYAVVPDEFDTTVFYESLGFVDLTVDEDEVVAMTANDAALAAYRAELAPEAAAEEATPDMLLDILLGVAEDG
ncbi:MAG: hypothetical protein LIO58_04150 [Oscillospiraceae bacterium]|nr:hypothetical protein [Oscillospiraceae bacterium]